MATAAVWARAYGRQAAADFVRFQALQPDPAVPECHKLQFLQMACEKLVKAHLCAEGTDPATVQSSHAYVAGKLPLVLRQTAVGLGFTGPQARTVLQHARHLAQEIELLAPAVKRGGVRPDNCEYPWVDGSGQIRVPLDWSFYPSQLLLTPAGRTILKLLRAAISGTSP